MADWVKVGHESDIEPGSFMVVDIDDVSIAVINVDGEFFAIEDLCSHDDETLTGGPIDGCEITCPRHGARFNIKTGEALTPPAYDPVATFPIKREDGWIHVRDDRWD